MDPEVLATLLIYIYIYRYYIMPPCPPRWPAGHTMRKYVCVLCPLLRGRYIATREEFNQLPWCRWGGMYEGSRGWPFYGQVDVSDNYTSIERRPSIVDATLHPSPPPQPQPWRPRLAPVRRPLQHHLTDSSFVPPPIHRHRHRHHHTLPLFPTHRFKVELTRRGEWMGEGKRRPCRKSLYVPRVNGFFSDGFNSRVPTADAV